MVGKRRRESVLEMWNETNMALTLTQEIQVQNFIRKSQKVVNFCICLYNIQSNHIHNKWGVLNPSQKEKEKGKEIRSGV